MNKDELLHLFQSIFSTNELPRVFFAPGRINLIGEHTDYNGGHVLPATISYGTYALARRRSDDKLRFYSQNFPQSGIIECELADLDYAEKHDWANFPKGMITYIKAAGFNISTGMDILFYGTIPNGAGLSSSASIELVTGVVLEGLYTLDINRIDMILIGQKVENDYVGVNSGIMDQFVIGKGKKDHALLLNCQTLAYTYTPLNLTDHIIMIMNTNKQRTLASSKYNERCAQCEQALTDLQTELDIANLGELTVDQFEEYKQLITNEVSQKRAKHAVYENERTVNALQQLQNGNLQTFGLLMNASHLSLKYDYEVTGIELDTLVQAAWDQPGVIGARMTGAGFGGCAIAIINKNHVDSFQHAVKSIYTEKIGYEPSFYTATIGDGARELTEECVL